MRKIILSSERQIKGFVGIGREQGKNGINRYGMENDNIDHSYGKYENRLTWSISIVGHHEVLARLSASSHIDGTLYTAPRK